MLGDFGSVIIHVTAKQFSVNWFIGFFSRNATKNKYQSGKGQGRIAAVPCAVISWRGVYYQVNNLLVLLLLYRKN